MRTLTRTTYAGTNDSHLRDLLAEQEGIVLSRHLVECTRWAAGEPSLRQHGSLRIGSRGTGSPEKGCCCRSTAAGTTGRDHRGHLALTLRAFVDDLVVKLGRLGGAQCAIVDKVPDWWGAGHHASEAEMTELTSASPT